MRGRASCAIAALGLIAAGCGQAQSSAGSGSQNSSSANGSLGAHAHPQAINPVAGGSATPVPDSNAPAEVSVDQGGANLAQPVSDAEVQHELAASGLAAGASQAALTAGGLAVPPTDAPPAVQAVIDAGNQIARLPYRFGGGHGTFIDTAYDCSGSISFVFAAAGLLGTTMTSGQLMSWGDPGPGKWITVFANAGHTFMYIAGLRFDTVALAETGSRWSDRSANESDLGSFVARHPPGL